MYTEMSSDYPYNKYLGTLTPINQRKCMAFTFNGDS